MFLRFPYTTQLYFYSYDSKWMWSGLQIDDNLFKFSSFRGNLVVLGGICVTLNEMKRQKCITWCRFLYLSAIIDQTNICFLLSEFVYIFRKNMNHEWHQNELAKGVKKNKVSVEVECTQGFLKIFFFKVSHFRRKFSNWPTNYIIKNCACRVKQKFLLFILTEHFY